MTQRTLNVHGPRGVTEHAIATGFDAPPRAPRPVRRADADDAPVSQIMSTHVTCATPDLPLAALIELVVHKRLGCVPIVDERCHPVGMVTKYDLVEQIVTPPPQLVPHAADVMMPLAITLGDDATVTHAASLMASEDMHHVLIVSHRKLVGVVSTMDITRWITGAVEGGTR